MSKILSISAALAMTGGSLAITAAPAYGQTRPLVVTAPRDDALAVRHVSHADLDLVRKADQARLTRRVSSAVSDVCQDSDGRAPLNSPVHQCRTFAWAGAKPQIARAIQRARDLAANGSSSIAAGSISVSLKK